MDYPPNFINLIGQTFGELYVFERAGRGSRGSFWARCSCGDERIYRSYRLRDGRTKCALCRKVETQSRRDEKSYYERWEDLHKDKLEIKCFECGVLYKKEDYRTSSLKNKNPKCSGCYDQKVKLRKNEYEKINKLNDKIFCSKCCELKFQNEFRASYLREPSPVCRKCSNKMVQEHSRWKAERDPIYVEKRRIGGRILSTLFRKGWKKESTAQEYLGIKKDGFIEHIESLFRGGMSWENRSEWHLDHVIPLSTAETPEDIKKLWHYTNLQPLWKKENEEKSNLLDWRDRFDWAKEVVELRKKRGLE